VEKSARYVIGIDLGTTNSCVAYVDTDRQKNPALSIQSFAISQLGPTGGVSSFHTLPSCYYLASEYEYRKGDLDLPWAKDRDYFVGFYALHYGSKTPTRLIRSAKSWLSHSGADRKDPILPVDCDNPDKRISPVEASTAFLKHIKDAWDQSMSKGDIDREFSQQEIVLTVPASFDEVARHLTLQSAQEAGYANVTLLEEPQAAFYNWISKHENTWASQLSEGDTILVCDVGGGTCDFSWIKVVLDKDGKSSFQRLAVGNHLLLGGDNMDIAIAHYLEPKIKGLRSEQWPFLIEQARLAKEALLSGAERFSVHIQGTGSSVIQGALSLEVNKEEIENFLTEGFFKAPSFEEAKKRKISSGIRHVGLPYETEPNISKHIASFLEEVKSMGDAPCPTYILFNGGTMKAKVYQRGILAAFQSWFKYEPTVLESENLDLAVSRGAAYFAKVRRGLGTRIGGGVPRAYYIEINLPQEKEKKALTLLERGTEEGTSVQSEQEFLLKANTPVSFQLLSSTTRLSDKIGDLLQLDPESLHPLPPIQTRLNFGKKQQEVKEVNVCLETTLSEIGLLELWLKSKDSPHRWKLEFQLKSVSGQDHSGKEVSGVRKDELFDETYLDSAKEVLIRAYSENRTIKPSQVMQALEKALDKPREKWSPSILRGLWPVLLQQSAFRKASPAYEARWWNLAGFFLRPGFGYPLDDHRMKEFWRVCLDKSVHDQQQECFLQRLIAFRRVSGGLNKGQQVQIATQLIQTLLPKKSKAFLLKSKLERHQYQEKIRVLAAFERIDIKNKQRLGEALIVRLKSGNAEECDFWALGRLGARQLLYGSVGDVIPKQVCEEWLKTLLTLSFEEKEDVIFLIGQLARQTKQREINISSELAQDILRQYKQSSSYLKLQSYMEKETPLSQEEQEKMFGDQLPSGLTIAT
jgi:hypothetical protein